MAFFRKMAVLATAFALLAGCSAKKTSFDTQGLRSPEGFCSVKPSQLGLAEKIRNINEGNGCQVPNAWQVRALGSIHFSEPATLTCGMAEPLRNWLEDDVQPTAQRSFGESVVSVDVAAAYACRARNNAWGAKMSEHGFGNAIDIAAFTLESGRRVSVSDGWNGPADEQAFLHRVHDAACGEFRTVLGPAADRHHHDHIHLDLQARANGGSYCR
jgi:hypothetical protein